MPPPAWSCRRGGFFHVAVCGRGCGQGECGIDNRAYGTADSQVTLASRQKASMLFQAESCGFGRRSAGAITAGPVEIWSDRARL